MPSGALHAPGLAAPVQADGAGRELPDGRANESVDPRPPAGGGERLRVWTPSGDPSSLIVVSRELLRASRRWQTWIQRSVFAGILLAFVGVLWANQVRYMDPNYAAMEYSSLGRRIFPVYSVLQVILLGILTPIVVAQAIIEEKSHRTMELLAITRLSPRSFLWGKLLSRLLTLEILIFAGLPVLALCLSLGGVEPVQVVNSFAQANTVVISLAAVAGYLSLYSKGPIVPAILTWGWGLAVFTFGALPFGVAVDDEEMMAWLSPFWALGEGRGVEIVGPLLLWVPISLVVVALAARVFAALSGGEDPAEEQLSSGLWAIERLKKRVGLGFALLTIAVPVVTTVYFLARRSRVLPWELFELSAGLWNAALLLLSTLAFLLVCRWGMGLLSRTGGRRLSWKSLAKDWDQDEDEPPAPGLSLAGPATQERRGRRHKPRFLRTVWGNPVAWREIRTTGHGKLTRWVGHGYIVALAIILMPLLTVYEPEWDQSELAVSSFVAFFVAAGIAVLVSTQSIVAEKRGDSLSLLCATKMSPAAILRGKLLAVAAFAGPPALLAGALMIGGVGQFAWDWRNPWYETVSTPVDVMIWRWAAMCTWGLAAISFLAVSCQAFALRARTPGRAWVASLSWAVALLVVPLGLRAAFRWTPWVETPLSILNPALAEEFFSQAGPNHILWSSAAMWLVLAAAVFILTARKLGARAER
jgi:ABC-type transport system involved in multi-copper enzyme maturation permease subunit